MTTSSLAGARSGIATAGAGTGLGAGTGATAGAGAAFTKAGLVTAAGALARSTTPATGAAARAGLEAGWACSGTAASVVCLPPNQCTTDSRCKTATVAADSSSKTTMPINHAAQRRAALGAAGAGGGDAAGAAAGGGGTGTGTGGGGGADGANKGGSSWETASFAAGTGAASGTAIFCSKARTAPSRPS